MEVHRHALKPLRYLEIFYGSQVGSSKPRLVVIESSPMYGYGLSTLAPDRCPRLVNLGLFVEITSRKIAVTCKTNA